MAFIFLISFLTGCSSDTGEQVSNSKEAECGDTLVNSYAEAFRVIQYKSYTQLDIIDPASDSVRFRYGKGQDVPSFLVDLGSDVETIAALSSTHVGMLKVLDLNDHIMGVSSKKYLCGDENDKDWVDYGDLGQSNPEMFVKHRPSLITYSGFQQDIPILKKLRKIGVPAMVNYDWKETHPLGRAEWLKVFGLLFDVEIRANRQFEAIEQEYLSLVESIQEDSTSPSVFVGTLYGDVFNVPAGESYMAKMIEDANVKYKYADTEGTGSLNISLEEIITTNRATNYWLNVAASSDEEILNMNQNFSMLRAFQERKVYTYFDEVNCFWEESAVAPHKVLSDLIHIFHPEGFENPILYYYKRVSQ
jgi:iron complex transport system substrate-binding protein